MKGDIWMRKVAAASVGALTAIVLAASIAAASSISPPATSVALTHKQVLQIALREARHAADPHPKRIEMATGPLGVALKVMGGGATASEEPVDLVVMYGHFKINAPSPRNHPIGPSHVLQLIITAYSGSIEARSTAAPGAPLSQLGPVTRLR
jgi:hypothetical protein